MSHPVFSSRMFHIDCVMEGVLLFILFILPVRLFANSSEELRLFHEPNFIVEADALLVHAIAMRTKTTEAQVLNYLGRVQAPKHQNLSGDVLTKNKVDTVNKAAYQYTGFISTNSTQYYFINGVPLAEFDMLEFVGVKLGGRLLQLKTPNGSAFELSVGQSISMDAP